MRHGHRHGRRDRPRGGRARQEGNARQHAHHLPQRQRRHAQRDVRGRGRHVEDQDPCDNGPYRDGKGSLYEGGTPCGRARPTGPATSRPADRGRDDPRRGHLSDARRARRRLHRQVQAARWPERLAHHQRRQALAAHRDRLQRRAVPRRHAPGRLEAHLAHAAAVEASSSTTSRRTRPRRTTSPPPIPTRSPRCRSARTSWPQPWPSRCCCRRSSVPCANACICRPSSSTANRSV